MNLDYDQLREWLVNDSSLYEIWQASGQDEEAFIKSHKGLIETQAKSADAKAKNKARMDKFMARQREKGNQTLTAIVDAETYNLICQIRDKAVTAGDQTNFGKIIGEALAFYADGQEAASVATSVNTSVTINDSINKPKEIQTEIPGPKQDVIQIMADHRQDGLSWPAVATALNDRKIKPARCEAWTGANAQTFYKRQK